MTPEQRKLAEGLLILPPTGQRKISKQEFAQSFPEALVDGKLSLNVLSKACHEKRAEDLHGALIIGHTFGFSLEHRDILSRLVSTDWHMSHEDAVSAMVQGNFHDHGTVDALYAARARDRYFAADNDIDGWTGARPVSTDIFPWNNWPICAGALKWCSAERRRHTAKHFESRR